MFRGTHQHNMDSKGRLSVPSRFREWLEVHCHGQLVITIDRDRCLVAYPLPHWEEIERKVAQMPSSDPSVRKFQRLFVGHAEELSLDAQGRVLVSPSLRQFASLEKAVVLVGQVHKFEIWDQAIWNQRQEEWLSSMDEDFARLGDLVL